MQNFFGSSFDLKCHQNWILSLSHYQDWSKSECGYTVYDANGRVSSRPRRANHLAQVRVVKGRKGWIPSLQSETKAKKKAPIRKRRWHTQINIKLHIKGTVKGRRWDGWNSLSKNRLLVARKYLHSYDHVYLNLNLNVNFSLQIYSSNFLNYDQTNWTASFCSIWEHFNIFHID